MNVLTVVKSNRVIEAGYRLTVMEQLILLNCIGKVDSRRSLKVNKVFDVSVGELAELMQGNKNKYRVLKEASERLLSRVVTINNPYPDRPRVTQLKTHWVSSVEYMPDDGVIRLAFAPKITPYLSELSSEFTRYDLANVGGMKSMYGIRLYEMMMQWRAKGSLEIEIAQLRERLKIEDKYKAIKDLKKCVIDPAIMDINEHSDYTIESTQKKTGRRVTHLTFTFKARQADKLKTRSLNERMVYGVPRAEVEAKARKGESWPTAAARIKSENGGSKLK